MCIQWFFREEIDEKRGKNRNIYKNILLVLIVFFFALKKYFPLDGVVRLTRRTASATTSLQLSKSATSLDKSLLLTLFYITNKKIDPFSSWTTNTYARISTPPPGPCPITHPLGLAAHMDFIFTIIFHQNVFLFLVKRSYDTRYFLWEVSNKGICLERVGLSRVDILG